MRMLGFRFPLGLYIFMWLPAAARTVLGHPGYTAQERSQQPILTSFTSKSLDQSPTHAEFRQAQTKKNHEVFQFRFDLVRDAAAGGSDGDIHRKPSGNAVP
ncbi:hypothetical protein PCANC_12039 [Puccinia coronata f. sp. avenae]|uniref:Secreted protein n=1 Tax=Puccinia coronata f. sp. avenae TaxID=200324 RepID=A0A2N5UUK4_9BASI|nr:hypothetical protein PCANC_12039 [Puccinia coronata f. sp. avenae]